MISRYDMTHDFWIFVAVLLGLNRTCLGQLFEGECATPPWDRRLRIVAYMKEVKSQLEARHVPVFMVDASVGLNFGHMTREGLSRAKGMVAFCTSEYGAYTGVGYDTFYELEFAHENELPLFPIRLCELWPPAPQNNERGTCQNKYVFKKSLVFAEDRQMTNAKGVADQIAASVARLGIFRTKLQL